MRNRKNITDWQRNAIFFIAGQFLSMFGSMLVAYAITWHITLQEQSGSLLAVFTCAALLPMVFISPFAGVWADRYNRKYLVNISDAVIALITLAVAVFYSAGLKNIWLLLAAVAARSIGQGVQQPAVNALIPQIVPGKYLNRFNGIQSTARSLTLFAAPMAAAALLAFLPLEQIFFIDVVTAAIGIAAVFFCVKVSARPRKHTAGVSAYYHDMRKGLRFIGGQSWLRTLIIASGWFVVMASPSMMMTSLQVARSFGDDAWRLAAVEIAFSIGMMLGGVAISVWGGFRNKAHTMVLALFLFGASTILLGVVPDFWVYLAVTALGGGVMPFYDVPEMTLMQTRVPPRLMGRAFSVFTMIGGVSAPLAMALFGPLGDIMEIELLLIITGTLLVISGFVLYRRKELLRAGETKI